jgi:transposase
VTVDHIEDIEVLRQMVKLQYQESRRIKAQLADALQKLHQKNSSEAEQLALQLDRLEKKHAEALKQLFGQKTERRPESKPAPATVKKERGHGRREQPELPIKEVIHKLDVADAVCDLCQCSLTPWDDKFEDSLEVDFIEPQVIIKKHRRQKYRCKCGGCIKVAPGQPKLFPKAYYSVNFALAVALKKYCYHMPLDRQRREFKRLGLDVTTSTLWDYLVSVFELLKPAYDRLPEHVLQQPVLGVDETTWRLLKTETKGKSKTWWVWARRCDNAVHYSLDPSRSGQVAKQLLGDYEGTVICDGYSAYESLSRSNPKLKLANCWAHARRELLAHEGDPRADRAIRVIRRIYRLETLAKEKPPDQLLSWRRRKTKPLLGAFFKWIATLEIPPTSSLRDALRYIQLREKPLMRFVDDARLSPDNNATERVLRSVVLGRKNHYGSRSERGTEVAAVFYSLLESAELAGVNPHSYLRQAVEAALDGHQVPLPHELTTT